MFQMILTCIIEFGQLKKNQAWRKWNKTVAGNTLMLLFKTVRVTYSLLGCAFGLFNFIGKTMRLYSGYLKQTLLYSALFGLSITIAGCSFSDSSGSISDSTSSIISSPSSVSGKSKKYQNEIADYTMAYVKSSEPGADYSSFLKGLSDIAAKEGVTNWEQDTLTYMGIGKGLKKANVEGTVYETYKNNFAKGDSKKMEEIQDGYESEK